jgi:hypothetical protein
MAAYTSVVQPGKIGVRWARVHPVEGLAVGPGDPVPSGARSRGPLSTEGTFARRAWTPADGLCDSKTGTRPIEMIPDRGP